MPLPPLATPADGEAYGYPAVPASWYARASVRVREFAEQEITRSSSTTMLTGSGPWRLPQRPVIEVTQVLDGALNPVAYRSEGSWLYAARPCIEPLIVTYTHGFDPVPDSLVELVCSIAVRMSKLPDAVASGARTEQAGGEAITWGVEAYNASSGLTSAEESRIRKMFPRLPRTINMRPAPLRGW